MVKELVRNGLMLCGGLLACSTNQAGVLNLKLQQHHVEWGQVINAKLIAQDVKTDLTEIDLAPLYEDFAVVVRENTSGAEAVKIQTLSLELYPRRVGSLSVPSLKLDDLQSQAYSVIISNAMVGDTAISVDLNSSSQTLWQRQQLLATVHIKSADRFFNVEAEPIKISGFEVQPFVMNRELINDDPYYRSSIQLGWAIFPFISGEYNLELPLIRYQQGGRTLRRFSLPRLAIQVRELPAYIPPNMPVAKVEAVSSIVANGLLSTGQLAYWQITLNANGTLAYWLPPVLHEVQSTNQIEFLPAKSRPETKLGASGVYARVTHEVPFKPRRIGAVALPGLKVQYFDPDTGRIESFHHQTASPLVWNFPMIVIIAVTIGVLLVRIRKRFVGPYRRHRLKQNALSMLEDAITGHETLAALKYYAVAQGWPANLTLSDFLNHWQQRYHGSTELGVTLQRLSRELYGGRSVHTLKEVQNDLLRHICQQKRRRRSQKQPIRSAWENKNLLIR